MWVYILILLFFISFKPVQQVQQFSTVSANNTTNPEIELPLCPTNPNAIRDWLNQWRSKPTLKLTDASRTKALQYLVYVDPSTKQQLRKLEDWSCQDVELYLRVSYYPDNCTDFSEPINKITKFMQEFNVDGIHLGKMGNYDLGSKLDKSGLDRDTSAEKIVGQVNKMLNGNMQAILPPGIILILILILLLFFFFLLFIFMHNNF